MKDLNELRDKAYQCAVEHGWHEEKLSDEHFLCLVVSELMEAVEADRKGKHSKVEKFKEWQGNSIPLTEGTRQKRFKEDFEAYIKGCVEEELADACIRLFDLSGLNDINLGEISMDELKDSYWFPYFSFTEYIYYFTSRFFNPEEIESRTIDNVVRSVLREILGFCLKKNIDIFWHIEQKMRYNELRPYKHGGKTY